MGTIKDFRSYEQMDKIYRLLETHGKSHQPYIVKFERGNQLLIFFGSRHSNKTDDLQVTEIENLWSIFIEHTNSTKVAVGEGGIRSASSTKAESITEHSEAGLLAWLARRDNIEVVSPEPDRTEEIGYLLAEGFTTAQILTYYFARQMLQWKRSDHLSYTVLQDYASDCMKKYGSVYQWNESTDLQNILSLYSKVAGKAFDPSDEKTLYELSRPSANSVAAASGLYRDLSVYTAIKAYWKGGKDIFAVYGSGHA